MSCTRPVAPSTGISAGPARALEHLRAPAARASTMPDERHGGRRPVEAAGDDGTQHERDDEQRRRRAPGAAVAEAHGEGALARLGVAGDVAQVVDHEQRGGQEPDRAPTPPSDRP